MPARQAPSESDLGAFLELSGILTGVDSAQLDPAVGKAILQNLAGFPSGSVAELLARSRTARSLADLEATGVFADPRTRPLADTIVQSWYTGSAPGPEGPVRVTWAGALQWGALGLSGPPGVCHGAWS